MRAHPWKAASRQAGGILVASVVAAMAFNLVPPAKIPWLRELPGVTEVSVDSLLASGSTAAKPAESAPVDTAAATTDTLAPRIDTAATPAAIDTTDKNAPNPAAITPPAQPPQDAATPKGISTDGAHRLFKEKKALFIDARPAAEFAKGHIPGAINVYAQEFEPHIPQLLGYSMDTLVVAYCGGGLCELSHELAEQLEKLGFKRVVVYTGGTAEWTERKLPMTGGQ